MWNDQVAAWLGDRCFLAPSSWKGYSVVHFSRERWQDTGGRPPTGLPVREQRHWPDLAQHLAGAQLVRDDGPGFDPARGQHVFRQASANAIVSCFR